VTDLETAALDTIIDPEKGLNRVLTSSGMVPVTVMVCVAPVFKSNELGLIEILKVDNSDVERVLVSEVRLVVPLLVMTKEVEIAFVGLAERLIES
jgi:hypothetical protein